MPVGSRSLGTGAIAGDYLPVVVVPAPEPPIFPERIFTIDLCVGWHRVAEAPAAIFDGVIRDLAAGEWRMTGAVAALAFEPGYDLTDIDTVRVVRDNSIVFSGYVQPVNAGGVGALTITDGPDGPTFNLTGPDAWSVLASRVCYPSPGSEAPWAASWDVRTGQASTIAAGYIAANAGGTALAARQIPGLSVVDTHAGLSGTWSARLQPLDQLVARICRDGQITCRLRIDFDGALTATLGTPRDRSHEVIISDQGGLTGIEQTRVPPSSTFVIAGGQGLLTARTFATAGAATGAGRRETFTDQSSLSTATEVAQIAATHLALAAKTLTVRAETTDAAAVGLFYGYDYDIGDTIGIEIADVRYPVAVESVTVHVGPDRSVIRPILGAATPDLVTGLIKDIAGLAARFDSQIA